jgi:hypothetical protein
MEINKKYLHDRVVLMLLTVVAGLLVVGVSIVLLRFDVSKNPTTIVSYRPNVSALQYQSGKPIDIYSFALFMILVAGAAVFLSFRVYAVRRSIAVFILGSSAFLLLLAIIVANALISLQ